MSLPPRDEPSYVLFDGSDLLRPRDRVRLNEAGVRAHPKSAADRLGSVVRRARNSRRYWILWDGLQRPTLCLDAHLKRLGLREHASTRKIKTPRRQR